MEIDPAVFRRKKINSSLRILLMAACAFSLVWITQWSNLPTQVGYGFAGIGTLLAVISIVTICSPVTKNRTIEVAPHLSIPAPLLWKGLDTRLDPLVYWQYLKGKNSSILFATNQRIGQIEEHWFTPEQWQLLLANLPELPATTNQSKSEELSWPPVLLAALCALVHYGLPALTNIDYFQWLVNGGYNAELLLDGQSYRALSAAFVHGGKLHLLTNALGLVVLASALGRAFSLRSMTSLLVISGIVSVTLGSLTTNATVTLGASGVMMGLFGFLVGAQRSSDQRLHPINRIPRQKFLYLLLLLELGLSLRFEWYGGAVHLVGIVTGYLYYRWLENTPNVAATKAVLQNAALSLGGVLTIWWLAATWFTYQQPERFARQLIDLQHPGLTAISAAALPDLPGVTLGSVRHGLLSAHKQLPHETLNSLAIARSNHWLGNTDAALESLRKLTGQYPGNELLHPLWLSVERDAAQQRPGLATINHQPANHQTTYLVSTDYNWVARLRLRHAPTPLADISDRLARHSWYLAGVSSVPAPGSYGMWPVPEAHYPTRVRANDPQ